MPDIPEVLMHQGQIDVLPYYVKVATAIEKYLSKKEIATKIWLPNNVFLLKRGSKEPPLCANELKGAVTEEMMGLRVNKLEEVKDKLTKQQIKVWTYFPPRKLIEMFYATNNEGAGRKINRLFFDVDILDANAESARVVAVELLRCMRTDKDFKKIFSGSPVVMWTGRSFHIYFLLEKPATAEHYTRYIAFNKDTPADSFTGRWAAAIAKATGLNVQGGHEKTKKQIMIDPSQTPSGKLARAPFSLHLKSNKEVDGIAIPLTQEQIFSSVVFKTINKITITDLFSNTENYVKALP